MDPSGTFVEYSAKAIGSGSEGAQQSLQEKYSASMSLDEAIVLALETLRQVMEDKLNSSNVEVMTMTPLQLFQMLTKEQVESYVVKMSADITAKVDTKVKPSSSQTVA